MARLIAVRLPRGPRLVETLDAIWAEGDAALPLAPDLPDLALHEVLLRMRPAMLIDHGGQVEVESPAQVPDGTAVVVMTSGSTGLPKGVVMSHRAMTAAATATTERLGHGDDRWLCVVPLHHMAGLQILFRSRLLGSEAAIHEHFDVDAIAQDNQTTLLSLVPVMLSRLLDAGVDLTKFRAILLGGAAVPPALLERAAASGANIVRTYGMTETCGGVVYDGTPLAVVEMRAAPEGEILLRGPMLLDGYRFDDALTDAALDDAWFHTGDLGTIEDGRLTVLGRLDDIIVTGGENVAPRQVEDALMSHPLVRVARVTGETDPEWGQVVVATIVAEGNEPSLAELRAHVIELLPKGHVPRKLVIVQDLPDERKLLE